MPAGATTLGKPVLVTGAGLIGALTACAVEQAGGEAVLLDIAPQETAVRQLGFRGQIVVADVADYDALAEVVRQFEVGTAVHTAVVQSRTLLHSPRLAVTVNIGGAVNVLEAARLHGLERVVLAGSSTVTYASFTLARSLGLPSIPEDTPSSAVTGRQTSLYAAAKASVEQFAAIYADKFSVDAVVLRYAAVLGHWDGAVGLPTEAVRALVLPALSGKPVLEIDPLLVWAGVEEFVDARDCAEAAVAALQAPRQPQVVFNISHPAPVMHADLCAAVRRHFPDFDWNSGPHDTGFAGYPVPRTALSDVQAAANKLNFRTKKTLQDSVDWIVEVERRHTVR